MYIERTRKRLGSKIYEQILLRESYRTRVNGRSKVQKRTLLNLSQLPRSQVEDIEWALKHPQAMAAAACGEITNMREGKSVGAPWVVAEMARRLGIEAALGNGHQGKLALWQIVARVLDQGSRLSAVRLHEIYALAEILKLERGFDEDDLYKNLAWLSQSQQSIERRLFKSRRQGQSPTLFLYDVTSSYLEGQRNYFGAYGYNRDGKKARKQIVVGLLCDERGEPVSVEVFSGNTQDPKTFGSQVEKAAQRFGCEKVIFVGDRGMIKQAQKEELTAAGFYYITALTKPQIEKLLAQGAVQRELFDRCVCEIEYEGQRLVLRRNPLRAEELAAMRQEKYAVVTKIVAGQNAYLADHPRAKTQRAHQRVQGKIDRLRINGWVSIQEQGRSLVLTVDEAARQTESRLDGCYVLISNVPATVADKNLIHERYKDLAQVERGFRVSKTGHLELRPIYVRSEQSTRGHVFVVMMAYLIRRELERAWAGLDVTVEGGLEALKTLCVIELDNGLQKIPQPREQSDVLLKALGMTPPVFIAKSTAKVATKRKLQSRRSTH